MEVDSGVDEAKFRRAGMSGNGGVGGVGGVGGQAAAREGRYGTLVLLFWFTVEDCR